MRPANRSRWREALNAVGLIGLSPLVVLLLALVFFVARAALFGVALAAAVAGLVAYPASPRLRGWIGGWAGVEDPHET